MTKEFKDRLKNTVITSVGVAVLMSIGATVGATVATKRMKEDSERYRVESGVIDSIKNSSVTVYDISGNLWQFYGEGFTEGQTVRITFDTMNTETIYDDEIIKVEGREIFYQKPIDNE